MRVSCARCASKAIKTRNAVVKQYLDRQLSDEYAKLAREHNYRARSAFKLLEIQQKHRIFEKGYTVLDVGAAPGSWSQVALEHVGPDGFVLGVDLQPMKPLPGVQFLARADIRNVEVQRAIVKRLQGRTVDALISDMAPSPTGAKEVDHERIVELARGLLRLVQPRSPVQLPASPRLGLVCKLWDGPQTSALVAALDDAFDQVRLVKPAASRDESAELFLVAKRNKRDK